MISVLCHLYHHHLWNEISTSISRIKTDKQVYVNLTNDKPYEQISKEIKSKFPNAKISVSPNQGKDIGGNLRLIDKWMGDGSPGELLIVCHGKNRDGGWRKELFAPLFSNYVPYLFKNNTRLGMVGNKRWLYHRSQDVNSNFYNEYCKRFGFSDTSMHFIAGTMFCVRSSIFKEFFSRFNAANIANELEHGDCREPSRTHSWERLYGGIITHSHYLIKPIEYYEDVDLGILQSFNEEYYLVNNPDVNNVVLSNDYSSGLIHYIKYGRKEGRLMTKPRNKALLML
jgi:hypothetical protein